MDFTYLVKQLDTEIGHLTTQLREKTAARAKLFQVLSPQEKVLVEAAPPEPEKKR
jgi:hypothetical protein